MKKVFIRCLGLFALLFALCGTAWAEETPAPDGEASDYIFQIRENAERSCAAELAQSEALFAAAGLYKTDDLALIERLEARRVLVQYEEDAEISLCGISDEVAQLRKEDYRAAMLGYRYAEKNGITGAGVKVAVIDSGLRSDFGNYTGAEILQGTNFLVSESDKNRHNTEDTYGHGTFVTSVICSSEFGLAPAVSILPLKCFDAKDGSYSAIIDAIDAAFNAGCRVINMSFGDEQKYAPLETAVRKALDAGIIVVAAAGNLGSGHTSTGNDAPMYPASYDGVISVSSVNSEKIVAKDAVQNDRVTVVAPGVSVRGLIRGGFGTGSGTSYSTPVVSAAAALALSVKPGLTPEEFEELLTATAEDLGAEGRDNSYGCGLADPALLLATLREDNVNSFLRLWNRETPLGYDNSVYFLAAYRADGKLLAVYAPDQWSFYPLLPEAESVKLFSVDKDTFCPLTASRSIE